MTRSLAPVVLLALAALGAAADPPKPVRLAAADLAAGTVLLFDGADTFGWKVTGDGQLADGVLSQAPGAALDLLVPLPVGLVEVEAADGTRTKVMAKGEPFRIKNDGKVTERIRAVYYTPEQAKPIFNCKDLTGWKAFDDGKRNLTKYSVTKDGELRAQGGPGDLQTEKAYADFVLQLECKTAAAGLNGGVFFRCVKGDYQQGYELQIQNEYLGGDRTRPKDYGTGAIYRRKAARAVVSDDKEWAHLTLIARGDKFATFVNGVAVLSWADDRPKDDNPRKGLRLAAGHLSLQGHDPTTDLLFRNLRLAEFPE